RGFDPGGAHQSRVVHPPTRRIADGASPGAGIRATRRSAPTNGHVHAGRGAAVSTDHALHHGRALHRARGGPMIAALLVIGLVIPMDTVLVSVELVETSERVTVE